MDFLPSFRLSDLVVEMNKEELGLGAGEAQNTEGPRLDFNQSQDTTVAVGTTSALPLTSPQTQASERSAADFLRCAREAGFGGLCDALNFCGLGSELASLFGAGVTILAPTDAAFGQLGKSTRCNSDLVRQLLLAHFCSGVSKVSDLQAKRCAVALAGQERPSR